MDLKYKPPWEQLTLSPEQQQTLYRDWGDYYAHTKQQPSIAVHYCDKALALNPFDHKALHQRSVCKRGLTQTRGALEDSLRAQDINDDQVTSLEICDALYELNAFEHTKNMLHNEAQKYQGNKLKSFRERSEVVDANIKETLGKSIDTFILENGHLFDTVLADYKRKHYVDECPLWKVLKAQDKCDVESIFEKEEILKSPVERARRQLSSKAFNQIYFNSSWKDVCFLQMLRNDPNLLLKQTVKSTPTLKLLTNTSYDIVKAFSKMLQARSPLYNEKYLKCPDKKVAQENREQHLYRVQYQVRRNMYTILRTIKQLRANGQIKKLSNYIESSMGDYVVFKTHRVMPWKFEFINEVYNTLALTYTDRLSIPLKYRKKEPMLLQLFGIRGDKYKDSVKEFKFGDKSTYQVPDGQDQGVIAYKKFVARLQKRLLFAQYSIEKSYLLHEIARSHINKGHFDKCCSEARKASEEAKICNNDIWQFLSILLICKSHAIMGKLEHCRDSIEEALAISKKMKSAKLCGFIQEAIDINSSELKVKRQKLTRESNASSVRRSRFRSISSYHSVLKPTSTLISISEDDDY